MQSDFSGTGDQTLMRHEPSATNTKCQKCHRTISECNANVESGTQSETSCRPGSTKNDLEQFEEGENGKVEDTVSNPRDGYVAGLTDSDCSIDDRLPETVKLLRTDDGVKVYLIGAAHFSEESQKEVRMIMQAVRPQAVLVELCRLRMDILKLDESTMYAQKLTPRYIIDTIKENGMFVGLFHLIWVNVVTGLTAELGIVPGGEFRTAYEEAQKLPHCPLYYGDRPINITIDRTLRSMSLFKIIKLCLALITVSTQISKEEVELYKMQERFTMLEAKLKEKYPVLNEVFITERDMYLSYMFHMCAKHWKRTYDSSVYGGLKTFVGVVGLGHCAGIEQHWGKVTDEDIKRLSSIPPEPTSWKVLRFTFKATLLGACAYVGYRYIPIPILPPFVQKFVDSSVEELKQFGHLVRERLL